LLTGGSELVIRARKLKAPKAPQIGGASPLSARSRPRQKSLPKRESSAATNLTYRCVVRRRRNRSDQPALRRIWSDAKGVPSLVNTATPRRHRIRHASGKGGLKSRLNRTDQERKWAQPAKRDKIRLSKHLRTREISDAFIACGACAKNFPVDISTSSPPKRIGHLNGAVILSQLTWAPSHRRSGVAKKPGDITNRPLHLIANWKLSDGIPRQPTSFSNRLRAREIWICGGFKPSGNTAAQGRCATYHRQWQHQPHVIAQM